MAFGQTSVIAFYSWGVAPGYGDEWPSAKFSVAPPNALHAANPKERRPSESSGKSPVGNQHGGHFDRLQFQKLQTAEDGQTEAAKGCAQMRSVADTAVLAESNRRHHIPDER